MGREQMPGAEMPNIQDVMFQAELETIRDHLEQGIGDVTGEEVMQKIQELFAETKNDKKLQDRVEYVWLMLDSWLIKKGIADEEAHEFSEQIMYLCAEMSKNRLEKKIAGDMGDVVDFK